MQTVFWAIVAIGILIFVHELGHFLVARWMGVRVLVFSLGFGPRLWSRQGRDGTDYVVAAVPLGGYVKMLGEGEEETPLSADDQPFSFSHKALWQRTLIVLAGPMGNFLFALLAMMVVHATGVEVRPPIIGKVSADKPAQRAGLQEGDRVVAVDQHPIGRWEALREHITESGGQVVLLTVARGEKTLEIQVQPEYQEVPNLFGEPTRVPLIGIGPGQAVEYKVYPLAEAIPMAFQETWRMVALTAQGIWKLLTRVVPMDQIGGPLLIAEMAGKAADLGTTSFLYFLAFVSVNLGLLNLLPIPILDGGHLLFYGIEAVKGSPVGPTARDMANRLGITLMLGLMVLALYNDLFRLLAEKP